MKYMVTIDLNSICMEVDAQNEDDAVSKTLERLENYTPSDMREAFRGVNIIPEAPIGAHALIHWNNTANAEHVYISFGEFDDDSDDDAGAFKMKNKAGC